MRCQRNEVALELVRFREGGSLVCDESASLVGEQREATEGMKELELLLSEQRGVGARPDHDRSLRHVEVDAARGRSESARLQAMGTEELSVCIHQSDGARADDVRHLRKDRARHVFRVASQQQFVY